MSGRAARHPRPDLLQYSDSMKRLRRNWDITTILLLFVTLGLAYSVVNPLHEATDELRHYRFVRYIVTYRALPVQGEGACRFQSHHPPLFYLLGALATGWIETGRDVCYTPPENPFWAYRYADVGVDNKNMYLHDPGEAFPWTQEALAAHIVRALNVLIGAGAVWLTWAAGRVIWPRRRALAAGGAAFVAFNPMFLYMSGAINNDVIAAFSGAAVLLASLRLLRDPAGLRWQWGVILGCVYGLALMSKFNMAVVALLIALAATWVAWRRNQWRHWAAVGLLTLAVAALIAGWWFVRNQLLYGEPTGLRTLAELWGARDPAESLPVALSELPYAWTTLWGRFGFGQIPLPEPFYDALRWLARVSLLGLFLPFLRGRRNEPVGLIAFLSLNVLLAFAVLFNYMLVSPAGAMGRFFFPGLPALALLIFYGLSRWVCLLWSTSRLSSPVSRWRLAAGGFSLSPAGVLALVANGGMVLFSLVALFGYLAPAYARPPSYEEGAPIPNEINARFDEIATLRGFRLSARTLRPGQPLDVDLYWEVHGRPPGNFLLFAHLIDEAGTMVTQRDTHPGTGNFPTGHWRPGERFVDSVRLHVPDTAYTPVTATLSVGLYATTYRLGITGPNGEGWGDAVELATLELRPRHDLYPEASRYPNPLDQNFNGDVRLIGYEYNRRALAPGEQLAVTLYWEALQSGLPDYVAQVRLLDDAGRVVAAAGARPQPPTSSWAAGDVVAHRHLMPIDTDLPPTTYSVEVALLNAATREPQNIVADDGHWIDDHLHLARIRLRPPVPESQ